MQCTDNLSTTRSINERLHFPLPCFFAVGSHDDVFDWISLVSDAAMFKRRLVMSVRVG